MGNEYLHYGAQLQEWLPWVMELEAPQLLCQVLHPTLIWPLLRLPATLQ
jgi:hypothetical protein